MPENKSIGSLSSEQFPRMPQEYKTQGFDQIQMPTIGKRLDRMFRLPNAKDSNDFGEPISEESVESAVNRKLDPNGIKGLKQTPSVTKQPLALFEYDSLKHNGLDNPLIFGAQHMKARLDRELKNGEDISNFTTLASKEPPDFNETNATVIKATNGNLIPFRVGDSIPPQNARQILVATTWRSGSSFTGDIFQHHPGVFYTYEPLHSLTVHAVKPDKYAASMRLLKSLLKCQYKDISSMSSFFVEKNARVYEVCRFLLPKGAACQMPEFYQAVCPLFPLQLMKTVRLRVEYTAELLADPELPNLKVIALIRDPRGTMNSRSRLKWCLNIHCDNLAKLCDELDRDITAAYNLREKYPGRVRLVRYEDLSTNPYGNVDKLFDFVGLPQNPVVEKFIKNQTQINRSLQDCGSHPHDSKAIAFAWRKKMNIDEIQKVQAYCEISLQKAGYQLIQTMEQRDDPTFSTLSKTANEIWPYDDINETDNEA